MEKGVIAIEQKSNGGPSHWINWDQSYSHS